MRKRQVNVADRLGLHARMAAKIVQAASRFKCSISLAVNGRSANARHILAVMLLAASVGSAILIETDGADEAEALEALTTLIGNQSA